MTRLQGFRRGAADGRDQQIRTDMRRYAAIWELQRRGARNRGDRFDSPQGVDHRPLRGSIGLALPGARRWRTMPTAAVLAGQNQEGDPSEANGIVAFTGEAAAAGSRRGVRYGAESEWARVADRIQVKDNLTSTRTRNSAGAAVRRGPPGCPETRVCLRPARLDSPERRHALPRVDGRERGKLVPGRVGASVPKASGPTVGERPTSPAGGRGLCQPKPAISEHRIWASKETRLNQRQRK